MKHHEVPLHRSWGILSGDKAGIQLLCPLWTAKERKRPHGLTRLVYLMEMWGALEGSRSPHF